MELQLNEIHNCHVPGIANHDVLPYSIFATFFATTGILLYRESSPIQPEPQQMSPTLITLTRYLNSETFSHLAYTRKQPPVCDHINTDRLLTLCRRHVCHFVLTNRESA